MMHDDEYVDFDCKTLDISMGTVLNLMSLRRTLGITVGSPPDSRCKHSPANKTSDLKNSVIRDHIYSCPVMESHYCRKSSKRIYLEIRLTTSKMCEQFETFCVAYIDPTEASHPCNDIPSEKKQLIGASQFFKLKKSNA